MVKRGGTSRGATAAAIPPPPPAAAAAAAAPPRPQATARRQRGGSAATPAGKPDRPPTPYELRVYKLCKAIPKGRVATYGGMAAALASSARAVGQAMRRNPYAPSVPCHRVVAADLQLGGFSGSWGIHCANVQRKKQLLAAEGVHFDGDKVCAGSVVGAPELALLLAKQPASVQLWDEQQC